MSTKKHKLKLVTNNNHSLKKRKTDSTLVDWLFPNIEDSHLISDYLMTIDQDNLARRMIQMNELVKLFPHYFDELGASNLKLTRNNKELEAVIQIAFILAFDNLSLGNFEEAFVYFQPLMYNFDELQIDISEYLAPYLVTIAHLGYVWEFDSLLEQYPLIEDLFVFRLTKMYALYITENYEDIDREIRLLDNISNDYIDCMLIDYLIENHMVGDLEEIKEHGLDLYYDLKVDDPAEESLEDLVEENEYEYELDNPYYQEVVDTITILLTFGLNSMVIPLYVRSRYQFSHPKRVSRVIKQFDEQQMSLVDNNERALFAEIKTSQKQTLIEAGYQLKEDFLKVTEEELLEIKGIGHFTVRKLKENGIIFKNQP